MQRRSSIIVGMTPIVSTLLVASTNQGKIFEFQTLLHDIPYRIVGLSEAGIQFEVEETGATFEENALIKARAYAQASGLLTLADDSGLCVDALGGAPGLFSARYGPDPSSRIARLLHALREVPDAQRTARFTCVIAIAGPDREAQTFEGVCEGRIAWEPRGNNGFGYDPMFYFDAYGQTMAELPLDVKNQVSHRSRAAEHARMWLAQVADQLNKL